MAVTGRQQGAVRAARNHSIDMIEYGWNFPNYGPRCVAAAIRMGSVGMGSSEDLAGPARAGCRASAAAASRAYPVQNLHRNLLQAWGMTRRQQLAAG